MNVYFNIDRSKTSPSKAVLPTVVFISTNHSSFGELRRNGFMLIVGWWDFAAKITIIFKPMSNEQKTGRTFWDFAAEQPGIIAFLIMCATVAVIFIFGLP